MTSAALILVVLLAQTPPAAEPPAAAPTTTTAAAAEEAAARSAAAAERAAAAAEKAAGAAEKAAEAASKVAGAAAAVQAAPAAPPAEEKKPEGPAGPVWTSTVALSLISLTGNATSLAASLTGSAERKSESWIFSFRLSGAYGQAEVAGTDLTETTALNGSFQARGARRFTPRFSGYLMAGIDTDHVASIEERPYGEAGLGILWLDQVEGELSKLKLNTDLAFRYGREFRFQYYPFRANQDDVTIVAPRFGLAFRYALTKDVIFTEDAEVLPIVVGDVRVLVNSTTKIAARVVSPLSVSVAFQVRYDSLPAAGKVPTDTVLSVGLEAAF